MYDVYNLNLGDKIKICRKNKRMTVDELAEKILKSKNAVYKYESSAVIPDAITLLEICNALETKVEELIDFQLLEKQKDQFINIFKTDKLYLYYISNGGVVTSILNMKNDKVMLYNGIKLEGKNQECAYVYKGNVKTNSEKAVFHLENVNDGFESYDEVDIKLDLKFTENDIFMGSITGINLENKEFVKKCIVTSKLLTRDEILMYNYKLVLTEEEMNQIKKRGYWELQLRQMNNYYVR